LYNKKAPTFSVRASIKQIQIVELLSVKTGLFKYQFAFLVITFKYESTSVDAEVEEK